jgi:hypothetical protein
VLSFAAPIVLLLSPCRDCAIDASRAFDLQLDPPVVAAHQMSRRVSNSHSPMSVNPALWQIAFEAGLSTPGSAWSERCVRAARRPWLVLNDS